MSYSKLSNRLEKAKNCLFIYIHIYIHSYMHIYTYMYICIYELTDWIIIVNLLSLYVNDLFIHKINKRTS